MRKHILSFTGKCLPTHVQYDVSLSVSKMSKARPGQDFFYQPMRAVRRHISVSTPCAIIQLRCVPDLVKTLNTYLADMGGDYVSPIGDEYDLISKRPSVYEVAYSSHMFDARFERTCI
jgi:hypothetical protein